MDAGDKFTFIFALFFLGIVCYAIQFWGYLIDGFWESFTINDALEYFFDKSFVIVENHEIFIIAKSYEFINKVFGFYNAGNVLIVSSVLGLIIPEKSH